jgi:hypothetical protein
MLSGRIPASCWAIIYLSIISLLSPVLLWYLGAGEHSCVVPDAYKLVDHGLRSRQDTRPDTQDIRSDVQSRQVRHPKSLGQTPEATRSDTQSY